jgi:D-ribose pyranase
MLEVGLLNRELSALMARLGHMDEIIVCDAGFPIPEGVRTVDLCLAKGEPSLIRVLEEISKYFSVEKIILANEMLAVSPTMAEKVKAVFGSNVAFDTIGHSELKKRSAIVKGIIRTGEFTAFSNVLIVSGSGNRWYVEKKE